MAITRRAVPADEQELARLENKEALGLAPGEDMGSESFKQLLALERAKSVHEPEMYSGQSQRALKQAQRH